MLCTFTLVFYPLHTVQLLHVISVKSNLNKIYQKYIKVQSIAGIVARLKFV